MIREETLSGKNVLITGGTGTLGRALVKAIRTNNWGVPKGITIFSRGEDEQKEMAEEDSYALLRFVPGDIQYARDIARSVQSDTHIVFHCAAMKDVVQCETYPYLASHTNILGVENLARVCSLDLFNVEKVVLISSDKAIQPTGVYGCTKLIGERIVIDFAQHVQSPVFSIVRLINLWASSGSVVPLFRRQIETGGPITITDKSMVRWFMWPSDAAEFILNTLKDARPGEIAIPPGYAMRITDLATALMMEADKQVEIKQIGRRPGEKLYEARTADHEGPRCVLRSYPLILPEFNPKPWGKDRLIHDLTPQGYFATPSDILKMIKEKGA